MRKENPHPRLLNEVMEAIAKLKELEGSTPKKISNQVEAILAKKRTQLRRDARHITKALKHGVLAGLITRIRGKYKLGLAKKDYDVYKNLTPMVSDGEIFREHRRRGGRKSRRGRRRRSRRRRRHAEREEDTDDNCSDITDDTASSFGTPIPQDRGRRRRKSRGRGRRRGSRRRGRRGRRHIEESSKKSEKTIAEDKKQTKKVEPKSSNDSLKSTGSHNDFNRNKNSTDPDDDDNIDDLQDRVAHVNCDSPECLCNMMPAEENKHDIRKTK